MEYQQLGQSDLNISRIGFGCMSLKPDQPDFQQLIHAAMDKGINYFDTADLYDKGLNETLLGKAFKGIRKDVIIGSKAGNQWRADGSGWDWNPRKDYILKCAEASLKRLQTDYLDFYMLHGGTIDDDIDESIEAFEILLQQGKIRYYGLSSIRPNIIRVHVDYGKLVGVMTQYNLLDRRPEEATLDLLNKNRVGVLVRGSVASGLLAGKSPKAYLDHTEKEVAAAARAVQEVSGEHRNAAQTAVRYVLAHPAVTSAVVGIRTKQQLEDAAGVMDTPQLNTEEMQYLQEKIPALTYQHHR